MSKLSDTVDDLEREVTYFKENIKAVEEIREHALQHIARAEATIAAIRTKERKLTLVQRSSPEPTSDDK